jgi:hypothetical protein
VRDRSTALSDADFEFVTHSHDVASHNASALSERWLVTPFLEQEASSGTSSSR